MLKIQCLSLSIFRSCSPISVIFILSSWFGQVNNSLSNVHNNCFCELLHIVECKWLNVLKSNNFPHYIIHSQFSLDFFAKMSCINFCSSGFTSWVSIISSSVMHGSIRLIENPDKLDFSNPHLSARIPVKNKSSNGIRRVERDFSSKHLAMLEGKMYLKKLWLSI